MRPAGPATPFPPPHTHTAFPPPPRLPLPSSLSSSWPWVCLYCGLRVRSMPFPAHPPVRCILDDLELFMPFVPAARSGYLDERELIPVASAVIRRRRFASSLPVLPPTAPTDDDAAHDAMSVVSRAVRKKDLAALASFPLPLLTAASVEDGHTALHIAVECRAMNSIIALLARGVPVSPVAHDQYRPLVVCVCLCCAVIASLSLPGCTHACVACVCVRQ